VAEGAGAATGLGAARAATFGEARGTATRLLALLAPAGGSSACFGAAGAVAAAGDGFDSTGNGGPANGAPEIVGPDAPGAGVVDISTGF
jgi:hypothetical protein